MMGPLGSVNFDWNFPEGIQTLPPVPAPLTQTVSQRFNPYLIKHVSSDYSTTTWRSNCRG